MSSGAGKGVSLDTRRQMLHVSLFGGLNLRLGETPVPPLDSARAESLLAYLLLHRDAPQPRQHLAFVLWPDSTESQARTNLRHVLHNLRRALPDADRFIEVRARTLQWRSEAPLWLDVAVFEQAVTEGRFEDAVETYTGDLLEGIYDDWLLEERERLRQLHLVGLEQLARGFEEQGRLPKAIRFAERLVRADPIREEAHRLLMRVYDASGDRARALRAYHVCAVTLQRELGIEPSAATRAGYEALLVAPEPVTRKPGAPAREPEPIARAALVGRATERSQLTALWRAVERGNAQLVMVTGEPGIGKTRLVEELRSWCAHNGAVTAEARAYPAEGAMAYGLVVTWLRSEPIAGRLRRLENSQLIEIARLVPELLTELPDLAHPEPVPESEYRRRLFGAVSRAILAAGTPLLLVADDLQHSDVETLQFVHYMLRAEPEARLLIAATVRREEIGARHQANQLVAALQALGRISEIRLERLSRDETGALAEHFTGRPLDAAEAARLYADSEGNPLFIVEALHAELETTAAATGVTSKVQAVIASRLAQLSEPAIELVGVAATIGREFTAEVLADASGIDEQTFVRGLDELWRRGLVRAQGPNAYDFSHGKIREVAYLSLSPAQMRHHHLRVAQSLERAHARSRDAVSGQIAAHFDRGGAASDAVPWYRRAAEAAQRLHANADAVRFLERALSLTSDMPIGTDRAALELGLLTTLPAPLVSVEGYLSGRVADVHERALDLARQLGVEPEPPLIRSLALANLTRGDFEAARPFGEQLRALAESDGDDVLHVESAYVLGIAAFWQGRLEEARAHFVNAIDHYRPEQRTAHLLHYGQDPRVFCLMRLACTLWLLGHDDDAGRARDAALKLAERSEHPYTLAAAHAWAAVLAVDQRDEAHLHIHLMALNSIDPEYRPRQIQFGVEMLVGLIDVLDGKTEAGIERMRNALNDGRRKPAAPGANAFLMRALLEAYAISGRAQRGLEAADEALDMGEGVQLWEAEVRRLRAGFLAVLGAESGEVETELTRALEVAVRQGARAIELQIREDLENIRAGTR